jgi:cell division protein FtsZ
MEVNEAAQQIREMVDEDANIIFGTVIVPNPKPEIKVTLIATGLQPGSRTVRPRPSFTPPPLPPSNFPPSGPRHDPPVGPRFDRTDDMDVPSFIRRRR